MNEGVYGPFSRKLLGNCIAAPSVHKVSRPPPKRVNPIQGWMKSLTPEPVEWGKAVVLHECLRKMDHIFIKSYRPIWRLTYFNIVSNRLLATKQTAVHQPTTAHGIRTPYANGLLIMANLSWLAGRWACLGSQDISLTTGIQFANDDQLFFNSTANHSFSGKLIKLLHLPYLPLHMTSMIQHT